MTFVPPNWKLGQGLSPSMDPNEFFFAYGKAPVGSETSAADSGQAPALGVECIGELGWHHLLAAASAGTALDLLCPDETCPLHPGAHLAQERNQWIRQYATWAPDSPVPWPDSRWERVRLLAEEMTFEADAGAPDLGYSVAADDSCDVCGACVSHCPEHVLSTISDGNGVALTAVDPGYSGCNACVSICPQHSLHITGGSYLREPGPLRELVRVPWVACPKCGEPTQVNVRQLEGIQHRLWDAHFPLSLLTRIALCDRCKESGR